MMVLLEGKPSEEVSVRIQLYEQLVKEPSSHEVLLKTCDRVECYRDTDLTESIDPKRDRTIIEHLFRVTAGLDSPILGENQIQQQVKQAYIRAKTEGRASKNIHLLFQAALRVGKQVRFQSELNKGALSHSYAVIEILRKKYRDLSNKTVVLVGVNHLNEVILRFLKKYSVQAIYIGNRSFEKAAQLAELYHARCFPLSELREVLQMADVLITATSAPHSVIFKKHFSDGCSIDLFDLSFPPDVDPEVGGLVGITYFDLNAIEAAIQKNLTGRKEKAAKAELLVKSLTDDFLKELEKRRFFRRSECVK